MGPPPLPPLSTPAQQPHKDDQYIGEKYRKLKRRYFDLEEVNFYAANSNTHRHPTEIQGSPVPTQTIRRAKRKAV